MAGITGISNSISSLTNNYTTKSTQTENDITKFQKMLEQSQNKTPSINKSTISSSAINSTDKLNGDYNSGFTNTFTSESDKTAKPTGFAANNSNGINTNKTIDKTSKLYEKSMELENYLVKMMLSSMRSSLSGKDMFGNEQSYAQGTYEDMLYDEMSTNLTKQANFGLADQIYLELV